jgi:hypothetical protein
MSDERYKSEDEAGRRAFCKVCIGGMAVLSGAMVGFPIVSFLARPEKPGANKPLEVPESLMAPLVAVAWTLRIRRLT